MTPVSQCPGYPRLCICKTRNMKWESALRVCGSLDHCSVVLAEEAGKWWMLWELRKWGLYMTPEVRCREAITSGTCWMDSALHFSDWRTKAFRKAWKVWWLSVSWTHHLPTGTLAYIVSCPYASSKFSLLKEREHAEGFSKFRKDWYLDGVNAGCAYQYSFPFVTFCNAANTHKSFLTEK